MSARRRLLLVEDEAAVAAALTRVAESRGYDVSVALDFPAAIAHLEQGLPDVVVVDIGLPGSRDGRDLLSRLQPLGIRTVVYTGAVDEYTLALYRSYGAAAVWPKGRSMLGLLDEVDRVLRESP